MTYNELMTWYEDQLSFIARSIEDDNSNAEYWHGYYDAISKEFYRMKFQCSNFPPLENGRYFRYRGLTFKVYFDDYGQQQYIYVNGEFIGGGSYNSDPQYAFSNAIDYALDKVVLSQILCDKNEKNIDKAE